MLKQKLMCSHSLTSINATLITNVNPDGKPPSPVYLKWVRFDTCRRSCRCGSWGVSWLFMPGGLWAVVSVCGWAVEHVPPPPHKKNLYSCRNLHHPFRSCFWAKLSTERLRRAGTSIHISAVCLTLLWLLIGQRILCNVLFWREPCTGASPVSLLCALGATWQDQCLSGCIQKASWKPVSLSWDHRSPALDR